MTPPTKIASAPLTAGDINTPLSWLRWIHGQAQETPQELATRKATGMPLVFSIALLSIADCGPSVMPGLAEIGALAKYRLTTSTMNSLVKKGYCTVIYSDVQRWKITDLGLHDAARTRNALEALIERALRPRKAKEGQ